MLGGAGLLAGVELLDADIDRSGPGAATSLAALGRVPVVIGARPELSATGLDADADGELDGSRRTVPPGGLAMDPKPIALWEATPTERVAAGIGRVGPGAVTSLAAFGRVLALIGARRELSATELEAGVDAARELA